MGLTITNEIFTDSGVTSELYINIYKIDIIKGSAIYADLGIYLNKDARLADTSNIAITKSVNKKFACKYPDNINNESIYPVIYLKLKEYLELQNFTIVDDI